MTSRRASAARIRTLRLDRGLSPEQLGCAVGVSGPTIRALENPAARRNPNARTQYAIAAFFGLRPSELFPMQPLTVRRRAAVREAVAA